MSQMTLRKLRDITLDRIDLYKPSESRFDPRLVEQFILSSATMLRKREVERDAKIGGKIDDEWFTTRLYPIEHGPYGAFVTLKYGCVTIENDKGVRVYPSNDGTYNPFVRFETSTIMNYPELRWAEGNIPWEYKRGIVKFPTLTEATFITEVMIDCIEDSTESGLDLPLAMPSDFQWTVMDMVFKALGIALPEDRRADSKPLNAE